MLQTVSSGCSSAQAPMTGTHKRRTPVLGDLDINRFKFFNQLHLSKKTCEERNNVEYFQRPEDH